MLCSRLGLEFGFKPTIITGSSSGKILVLYKLFTAKNLGGICPIKGFKVVKFIWSWTIFKLFFWPKELPKAKPESKITISGSGQFAIKLMISELNCSKAKTLLSCSGTENPTCNVELTAMIECIGNEGDSSGNS